jgi:hypothetical protein
MLRVLLGETHGKTPGRAEVNAHDGAEPPRASDTVEKRRRGDSDAVDRLS